MSYASPNDLIERYDARILGDLCQDEGERITDVPMLLLSTKLLTALSDASGMVNSAALVGKRYTSTQLTNMIGDAGGFIKRLTCDLAFAFLRQRRGYDVEQFPTIQESFNYLDRLRLGERVFDIEEVESKGNPTSFAIPVYTVVSQNLMEDNNRYFPNRRWGRDQFIG